MRRLQGIFINSVCVVLLGVQLQGAQAGLEVIRTTEFGAVDKSLYRATVCPNGTTIVTNASGEAIVIRADGSITKNQLAELKGASACACDGQNRVYVGATGWVRQFDLTPAGGLAAAGSFYTAGGITRLLATPTGELYVLGLAKVAGQYVMLRRFQLPDGGSLGVVPLDLPVRPGGRFNQLAMQGSLVWHPVRRQALYLPANPLRVWCFDEFGRVDEVVRPSQGGFSRFTDVELDSLDGSPPMSFMWDSVDLVFNSAVGVQNGKVYLQVRRGRPAADAPEAVGSYLAFLDERLQLDAETTIPLDDLRALFVGTDNSGNLYFVQLPTGSTGVVMRTRVTEP